MKVIVCQHGARRRYAVARILEEAGLLEALYTDSSDRSILGMICKTLAPFLKGKAKRLANRNIRGIPHSKIFSTDIPIIKNLLRQKPIKASELFNLQYNAMTRQLFRWGLRRADVCYSMDSENIDFISYAKKSGVRIIIDVCVNPLTHRVVLKETERFSNWAFHYNASYSEYVRIREKAFVDVAELADILLCPSEWVAEGVRTLCPKHIDKIKVCPYGSSITYGERTNSPIPGRFFWAGGDPLRKGLHYLAKAAEVLTDKYSSLEFRVAGVNDTKITNKPECKELHFLGKLNKDEMTQEYLSADAFVFPTISEGFAAVVIEALSAGCPVITTRCSGMPNFHGIVGFEVNPSDVNSLIQSIDRLYMNRELREALASNTKEFSRQYTEEEWAKRLVRVVAGINTQENKI